MNKKTVTTPKNEKTQRLFFDLALMFFGLWLTGWVFSEFSYLDGESGYNFLQFPLAIAIAVAFGLAIKSYVRISTYAFLLIFGANWLHILLLFTPWGLFFLLGLLDAIGRSVIIAGISFVIIILYRLISNKFFNNRVDKVIVIGAMVSSLLLTFLVMGLEKNQSRSLVTEQQDREEFVKNIQKASLENKLRSYSTEELIASGVVDGVYQVKDGQIINGYGGTVESSLSSGYLTLTYTGIPNGDQCYGFYFYHPKLDIFRFDEPVVNGFRRSDFPKDNIGHDEYKQLVCYDDNRKINEFKFTANIDAFIESASWTLHEW